MSKELDTRARATVVKATDLIRDYLDKIHVSYEISEYITDVEQSKDCKGCQIVIGFTIKEGQ
jgi:hypothetical protein